MFINWKGRGWLVAVATGGCLLASDYLTGLYYHDSNFYAQHGWPKLAAFWAAAAIVQLSLPRRDEVPNGTMDVRQDNSLFREQDALIYVPIRWWPLVLFLLGIAFYFVRG